MTQGISRRSSVRWRATATTLMLTLLVLVVACSGSADTDDAHVEPEHEKETTLFVVKAAECGHLIPVDVVDRILGVQHMVGVECYLRLRMPDFDVVGVEPGAPLRIMTEQPDVHLLEPVLPEGFDLAAWHAGGRSVLVGVSYAQDAELEAGDQFSLPDTEERLTTAVIFSISSDTLSRTVVVPLEIAWRLYPSPEQVTHFWVTVDLELSVPDVIRSVQLELGDAFQVLPRTVAPASPE